MNADIQQQIQNVQENIARLEAMPPTRLVSEISDVEIADAKPWYADEPDPQAEWIPASEMLSRLRLRLTGLNLKVDEATGGKERKTS